MTKMCLASFAIPFALLLACGGHRHPTQSPPAAAPSTEPVAPVQLVSTSFVVGQCPDGKTMNARAAETAMRKLVAHCESVPGKGFHFKATLVPGGRIELASPGANRDDGVVPTCVLRSALLHSVALKDRCVFDVRLDERPVPGPSPSAAPAASTDRP
jgi:hypothetical protein